MYLGLYGYKLFFLICLNTIRRVNRFQKIIAIFTSILLLFLIIDFISPLLTNILILTAGEITGWGILKTHIRLFVINIYTHKKEEHGKVKLKKYIHSTRNARVP